MVISFSILVIFIITVVIVILFNIKGFNSNKIILKKEIVRIKYSNNN